MGLQTWATEVKDAKRDGCTKEKMMELEARLQKFQDTQSDNTKKVMARMGSDQDATLVNLAWSAWLSFSEDYKKNKVFEDQVKQKEKELQEHMNKKKEDARLVMERMNGATDSGLMAQCIQGWYQAIIENRKARDMEEKVNSTTGKFKSMQNRHKSNATNVQGRINEQIKSNLLLRCVSLWMLESKVGRMGKYYTKKMEHKRQQLNSVQTLFRSFAKQLEEGLGNLDGPDTRTGDSTDRVMTRRTGDSTDRVMTRRSKAGMHKDYGSVSLPDINQRPMHA